MVVELDVGQGVVTPVSLFHLTHYTILDGGSIPLGAEIL